MDIIKEEINIKQLVQQIIQSCPTKVAPTINIDNRKYITDNSVNITNTATNRTFIPQPSTPPRELIAYVPEDKQYFDRCMELLPEGKVIDMLIFLAFQWCAEHGLGKTETAQKLGLHKDTVTKKARQYAIEFTDKRGK